MNTTKFLKCKNHSIAQKAMMIEHAEHGAMLAKLQLRRCKFSAAKNFFPDISGGGFEPVNPPLKYGPGPIIKTL